MLKYIFFDLDGTMLPMNQEDFIKVYFTALCERFCPVLKLDNETLIKYIWKSTSSMIKNDGSEPNIKAFWRTFAKLYGKEILGYVKEFDNFYQNEFFSTKKASGYNPNVPEAIKTLRRKGYTLVAATNPLFPEIAINTRLGWAGVGKEDFALVTTYENSSTCKPNPKYFEEIMGKLKAEPKECLMVGNDVDEDILSSKKAGMSSYLITDCLINKSSTDYSEFKNGTMRDFLSYARRLPDAGKR
ncbi:MAG: HAD family hydrolase [Ruminococcus sp.]|nr:HAD family hydrolase [Ruminococcus sp.]